MSCLGVVPALLALRRTTHASVTASELAAIKAEEYQCGMVMFVWGFFLGGGVQLGLEGTAEDDVTIIITLSIRRTEMAAISSAPVVHSHTTSCLPLKGWRDGCERCLGEVPPDAS